MPKQARTLATNKHGGGTDAVTRRPLIGPQRLVRSAGKIESRLLRVLWHDAAENALSVRDLQPGGGGERTVWGATGTVSARYTAKCGQPDAAGGLSGGGD